jgi:hypothetical protein
MAVACVTLMEIYVGINNKKCAVYRYTPKLPFFVSRCYILGRAPVDCWFMDHPRVFGELVVGYVGPTHLISPKKNQSVCGCRATTATIQGMIIPNTVR